MPYPTLMGCQRASNPLFFWRANDLLWRPGGPACPGPPCICLMVALWAEVRFLHAEPKTCASAEMVFGPPFPPAKWRPREADLGSPPAGAPREGPHRPLGRATWRDALGKHNQSLEFTPNFENANSKGLALELVVQFGRPQIPMVNMSYVQFSAPSTPNKVRVSRADGEQSLLFLRPAVLNTSPVPVALTVSIFSGQTAPLLPAELRLVHFPQKNNDRWGECAKRPCDSLPCLLC
eukprot:gene9422-biopygen10728